MASNPVFDVWDMSDCLAKKCLNSFHADYIISAITREDLEDLKRIFKTRCRHPANVADKYGRNPLHMAVSCGKDDIAEWLIDEFHVDVEIKDQENGWNSLHRSLYFGNIHCAVMLLQHGLDYSVEDKEGINAIKLVHLDSQREKSLKKEDVKLGRVILPYQSSESGELSLEMDELIDIVKMHSSTGWAVGRKSGSRETGRFPLNFVEVLGSKMAEMSAEDFTGKGCQSDVYMWGNNSNLTLGQADAKSRENPGLIETLWTLKCSIKQVGVSKYHSVFLCEDGSVFTCGQGRGGRLGHGNEQTILCPKQVEALKGIFCTEISTARDHTLILDEMGQVYSFGLNTYHQLGHYPAPQCSLIPKMITSKLLKGKIIVGIAAARFHSAIFTRNELFTFGLNAGQLGQLKGDDLQSTPRISMLPETGVDITHVAVSDGATSWVLSNGDLYVLQDFNCKKIAKKMTNTKKLVMSGGELEARLLTDLQYKDPDELCIAVLKDNGMVQCWKKGFQNFKDCVWAGRRRSSWIAIDISLGKHLLIATDEGVVFHGFFRGNQHSTKQSQESKSNQNKPILEKSFSLADLAEDVKKRKEDQMEVMMQRVPLLYRGYQVSCDVKSKTFAVIQNDPKIGLKRFPRISSGCLDNDLLDLLNEADLEDGIGDVHVKVKNSSIAAHHYILASRLSQNDLEALSHFDADSGKYLLDFKNQDLELVKKWLCDVYTGKSSSLLENFNGKEEKTNGHNNKQTDLTEAMRQFSLRDLESPDCMDSGISMDGSGELAENIRRAPSKRGSKNKKKKEVVKKEVPKRKNKTSDVNETKKKGFAWWSENTNLSDIIIESEDEVQYNCHKCILYARLDYFRGMLGNPWLEASWLNNPIKMQIPGKVLKIILDYLYTDELQSLKDCKNINLLCDVIIYADQLLITRLREICEDSLSKLISLKNALEMLDFSCTYNAKQLKIICCEFISINLTYYLEIRALESFSSDVLKELSNVYKELIPGMAYRRITPSTYHLEVDKKLQYLMKGGEVTSNKIELLKDSIFEESLATSLSPEKQTSSAKKRRRRRRTSSAKESFSEDQAVSDVVREVDKTISPRKTELVVVEHPLEEKVSYHVGRVAPKNNERIPENMEKQTSPMETMKTTSAPRIKSFRDIMEEEQKQERPNSNTIRNAKVAPSKESPLNSESLEQKLVNPAIKWDSKKKLSQKQRKNNNQSDSSLSPRGNDHLEHKNAPDVEKEKFCPWGKPAAQSSVKAFKDVMGEELKGVTPTPEQKKDRNFPGSSGARRRLRIWSKNPLASSPPSASLSLSAIMESQQEEKKTSARVLQKPLTLIQIEEKAMEELLLHYKAKDNPAEYITVERIRTAMSTPIWKIDDKS